MSRRVCGRSVLLGGDGDVCSWDLGGSQHLDLCFSPSRAQTTANRPLTRVRDVITLLRKFTCDLTLLILKMINKSYSLYCNKSLLSCFLRQ